MKDTRGYLIVFAVLSAVTLSLRSALAMDPKVRNSELFTEMVYSKASESFSASSVLPGGITQQRLVPGVVPRGLMPLGFGTSSEEAERAGRALMNPIAADDKQAAVAGAELYGTYCSVCHDKGGNGRGPVVLHGMLPPPSLHAARATQMPDGQMFHILTFGQGNMGPYAAQLNRKERWEVIRYVRQLQEQSR